MPILANKAQPLPPVADPLPTVGCPTCGSTDVAKVFAFDERGFHVPMTMCRECRTEWKR